MMKKESEEKTIKELFQQLKQEDERDVPSFVDTWAAAQSSKETRDQASKWIRPRWLLAAAAVIIIAVAFIGYRTIQNKSHIDNREMTEKAPASQPSVNLEEQVTRVSAGLEPGGRARSPKSRRGKRPRTSTQFIADAKDREYTTDFFLLRYGNDHESMESGELIRVQMPRSALITFGLPVNVERAGEMIKADLLIGEDGLARAIRFVR
jgi:hypothetical protein